MSFKESYDDKIFSFDRRGVYAPDINDTWAFDLVDMSSKRAGYILNIVDVFSRHAMSIRIHSKHKESIKWGLTELFKKAKAKPKHIWSDMEPGLVGAKPWLEKLGIHLYHTNNSYHGPDTHSVPIVEVFNRGMRRYMMKTVKVENPKDTYQTIANKTVQDFLPFYNDKIHSTLGVSPNDVYYGKYTKETIRQEHINRYNEKKKSLKPWKVGDKVLLQKPNEGQIRSKYEANYYDEPFTISEVIQSNPITYKLEGLEGIVYRQQMKLLNKKVKKIKEKVPNYYPPEIEAYNQQMADAEKLKNAKKGSLVFQEKNRARLGSVPSEPSNRLEDPPMVVSKTKQSRVLKGLKYINEVDLNETGIKTRSQRKLKS